MLNSNLMSELVGELVVMDQCIKNNENEIYMNYQKEFMVLTCGLHSIETGGKKYVGITVSEQGSVVHIDKDLKKWSDEIKELAIVVMEICSELQYINFPNLKKLKIISEKPVFLNEWKMPMLDHLDVTECPNCVFDDCNLINLSHLYIHEDNVMPLRFCLYSKDTRIVTINNCKTCDELRMDECVANENIFAYQAKQYDWRKNYPKDTLCDTCKWPLSVDGVFVKCYNEKCHKYFVVNILEGVDLEKVNKYPHCKTENHECPLFIFMDKYGYGIGYCHVCESMRTLSRLEMYAAWKIGGTSEYPIITPKRMI